MIFVGEFCRLLLEKFIIFAEKFHDKNFVWASYGVSVDINFQTHRIH